MIERFIEDTKLSEGKNVDKNEILMGFLWAYWLFNDICVCNIVWKEEKRKVKEKRKDIPIWM